jgi:hypothetical protein
MKYLNFIKSDAKQEYDITLLDNTQFKFSLEYSDQKQGWTCSFQYEGFNNNEPIKNIRICTGINIFQKWKNLLSFGIFCFSDDNSEPYFQDDFKNGRVMLYLIEGEELN